jgi:hypothetical protein
VLQEGLFDAVIADRAGRLMSTVTLDADDLPGWAVAMYDENLRNPQLVRLLTWLRLERRPEGDLGRTADHAPKLAEIARAQAAGAPCWPHASRLRSRRPGDQRHPASGRSCGPEAGCAGQPLREETTAGWPRRCRSRG